MPGAGTKPATTTPKPPARLLDLTRLISRVGRGPFTGVDRVEMAYLRHLSAAPEPLFLLIRTPLGFLLLPDESGPDVLERLEGEEWGDLDLLGRLARHWPLKQRQALAFLRRQAIGRCRPHGLARMLGRHLPAGTSALNVGHVTLEEQVFTALRAIPEVTISVLLHDAIPLDFPQFTAAGQPERFAEKLAATARHADQVIYTSHATQRDMARHMAHNPHAIVAPLGIEPLSPTPDAPCPQSPYFVVLGTIEPRKNHALLLDVWEQMGANAPTLCIVGRRGWRNLDLFARLDALQASGASIHEFPDLNDGDMAALVANARAMLFPSFAEGFGLPPLEAAALGTPVIASDLPVLRELLGDFPVYLSPHDAYSWATTIQAWAASPPPARPRPALPTWDSHFAAVLAKA